MIAETLVGTQTLRDPDAALLIRDERVFRLIHPHAISHFKNLLGTQLFLDLVNRGSLVDTRPVLRESLPCEFRDVADRIFEHEKIPFVSQPSEWSPSMLADAAARTLEIARELLSHGMTLKDATPSNLQFRDAHSVFVDVPSIIRRPAGTFIWNAQQQFFACFLLPLIANHEAGVPLRWMLQDTYSGITHAQVARLVGLRGWLRPYLLRSVVMPALLGRGSGKASIASATRVLRNDRQAVYILERQFETLEGGVDRLRKMASGHGSHWRKYAAARLHYPAADLNAKREFVATAISVEKPAWTLDVGSNTGEFSEIAASCGKVVAIDSDETSVSGMFDHVHRTKLPVLPLVVDLANPTPGRGWRNAECNSFLDRASGRFDLVMLLAVIHHLRVSAGIPLRQILCLLANLSRRLVIIEWVPASDPMFAQISRGRDALYEDYTQEQFENLLTEHFAVERSLALSNGRSLYLARKHEKRKD